MNRSCRDFAFNLLVSPSWDWVWEFMIFVSRTGKFFFPRQNLVLLNGVKAHFKILYFSKSSLSPGRESFIHDTTWCLCSSGSWSPPGGGRRGGDTGSSYMFFFLQADTLKMPHECTSRILNWDASSGNAHLDLFAENSLMKSWSRKFSFVENIWRQDNSWHHLGDFRYLFES